MKRQATAVWQGALKDGTGTLTSQSGALSDLGYSFKARFEDESGKSGTNPEELIAAAHAGCLVMQLSHFLAENGTPAERLEATATVELIPGEGIKGSAINLQAKVPSVSDQDFQALANKAKEGCPVSKALASINITLNARLV